MDALRLRVDRYRTIKNKYELIWAQRTMDAIEDNARVLLFPPIPAVPT